jgi:hypothetical protein
MKNTTHGSAECSILKKHEPGIPVKEICIELALSDVTFYTWKSKYDGIEAQDLQIACLAFPMILELEIWNYSSA